MAGAQVKGADMTSFNNMCSSWKPRSSSQDESAAVQITAVTIGGGFKGHTNADFIVNLCHSDIKHDTI